MLHFSVNESHCYKEIPPYWGGKFPFLIDYDKYNGHPEAMNGNISCGSRVVSLLFESHSVGAHPFWKQHKAVWEARVLTESG